MTRTTGRQIKNALIFILSATLLTTLMILGPYYLESCLQDTHLEASREVPIASPLSNPITLNSEYFEWKVSINLGNFYDLTAITPSSETLPSSNSGNKLFINSFAQADASTK